MIDLAIRNGIATAKVGDATERFDLEKLRWQDEESGQWVTLTQCENWAELDLTKKAPHRRPVAWHPLVRHWLFVVDHHLDRGCTRNLDSC